jgi:hypothetical protein
MNSSVVRRILVFAAIALPVAPVLSDYLGPGTRARWLLADAANQFDKGNVQEAQSSLHQAFALSKDIVLDGDFWRQFERIEADRSATSDSSDIWEHLLKNVEDENQRAATAIEISQLLAKRKQFEAAAKLLALNLPADEDRTPLQLNQLAYMRSLAGIELDEALLDINRALAKVKNESLLDTKAWVLNGLGRHEDALQFIETAISTIKGKLRANSSLEPMITAMDAIEAEWLPKQAEEAKTEEVKSVQEPERGAKNEEAIENDVPREPTGALDAVDTDVQKKKRGWATEQIAEEFPAIFRAFGDISEVFVVMRYHRMRILEALGRPEEAAKDQRWLEAFSTDSFDDIH